MDKQVWYYPISHPEILTSEALIDRSPRDFYGLIKCDVLPPSFLFHPVLPYRAQGKLMFPLCRACAENLQETPCEHSKEEHMLSGTWCSIEIGKALDRGYRVIRMVEVWHFLSKSSDLFTGYTDTFLKIKQEASGCGRLGVKRKRQRDSISENTKEKKVSNWTLQRSRRTLGCVR